MSDKLTLVSDNGELAPVMYRIIEWGHPVGDRTNKPITVHPPSVFVRAHMRMHGMNTAGLAEALDIPVEEADALLNGMYTLHSRGRLVHKLAEVFGPTGSGGHDSFWWEERFRQYYVAGQAPTRIFDARRKVALEIVAAEPQDGGE